MRLSNDLPAADDRAGLLVCCRRRPRSRQSGSKRVALFRMAGLQTSCATRCRLHCWFSQCDDSNPGESW